MIYSLGEKVAEIEASAYVAPGAVVIGNVKMAENASIWFNAVLRADNDLIQIGVGSNVQDGSVLHVDPGYPLIIGDAVTIGHKVMLHGCRIGDGSLIGMNAVVLNGVEIGEECLIGANSLVTEGMKIPPRSLVLGSPAKVVSSLSEKHLEGLASAARHYQEKIPLYKSGLKLQAGS